MLTSTSASLNGLAPPRSSWCLQHIWPAAGVYSTFDQQLVSTAHLTSSWCLQHIWPAVGERAIGLSGYCVKMSSVTSVSLCLTQGLKGGGGCQVSLSHVWNLRAVVLYPFPISPLVLLPNPVALSVLSCFCLRPILLAFFLQKIVQYILLRCRLFVCVPCWAVKRW